MLRALSVRCCSIPGCGRSSSRLNIRRNNRPYSAILVATRQSSRMQYCYAMFAYSKVVASAAPSRSLAMRSTFVEAALTCSEAFISNA